MRQCSLGHYRRADVVATDKHNDSVRRDNDFGRYPTMAMPCRYGETRTHDEQLIREYR
jgi:hypothetical protein